MYEGHSSSFIKNIDYHCLQTLISGMSSTKITDQSVSLSLLITYVPTAIQVHTNKLGGSVVCAVRLETRRSRVQPPPRSAIFFRGD